MRASRLPRGPAAAFALLALVLAGCLTSSVPPAQPLDPRALDPRAASGSEPFHGLTTHAALLDHLAALEAEAPGLVEVRTIGASVEGRAIPAVTLGGGPFELWLAARHHGNEPTATEAVLRLTDLLLGRAEPGPLAFPVTRDLWTHRDLLLERLTFVVVPMANPDGAEADQRHNVAGQDLNRDYLLFTQPETRALRDLFWEVWPDAGLDLHNEGLYPGYDYDAFYPEVPRAEAETQVLSLRNQWLTVREVEAAGSFAGGPNENYKASRISDPCNMLPLSVPVPPPTDDTNPTAYCEGTHDAFLSIRGAPGWTPEAAIGPGGGAEREATLPWAIAQHEATIASTALLYAGAYDACTPVVQKFAGTLRGQPVEVAVATTAVARFQLVWRHDATGLDLNVIPASLTLTTAHGQVLGPEAPPAGFHTATLWSHDPGAHVARVAPAAPLAAAGVAFELRVHECLPRGAALEVTRVAAGLRVANRGALPLALRVVDSLTGGLAGEVVSVPDAAEVRVTPGNAAPRTLVAWDVALAPGEAVALGHGAPEGTRAGPARWHAVGPGGVLLVGATPERAGAAPGAQGAR